MLAASVVASERGALPTATVDSELSRTSRGVRKRPAQSWKPITDNPSRFTLFGWDEMVPEFKRKQSRFDFQKAAVATSPIEGTGVAKIDDGSAATVRRRPAGIQRQLSLPWVVTAADQNELGATMEVDSG